MLINIFGKRGAGKTTLIRGNLKNFIGPVVVLDILGNFASDSPVQVKSVSEAADEIIGYCKEPHDEDKIIVVQTADPDFAIEHISPMLWYAERGTLVLDEVDGFSPTEAPCFDQLVRYGRNKSVNIVTGCRRPAEVSRNITAGANQLYAFRTNEPRDIDYFRATIFGQRAEQLMTMEPFHGLMVNYDDSTINKFKIDPNGLIYILESSKFE